MANNRFMSSSVNFESQQVQNFVNGIRQNLINPEVEVKETERFVLSTIQDHFNKTMSPVGRWKPSKAAIRENRLTLTKTRALRDGLKAQTDVKKTGLSAGVNIRFLPSAKTRKYAYTHNNGLSVKIFGKRYYHFPKRQFAWLSNNDKKMIEDIWLGIFS